MSLTSDWFEDAPNRKKRWDGEGLSLKEGVMVISGVWKQVEGVAYPVG
ncbi:hypothetical protein [Marinobacter flavimaris]